MTTKSKTKKKIEYTIEAKLVYEPDECIDIDSILDSLRGTGSAEVTDVRILEGKDA